MPKSDSSLTSLASSPSSSAESPTKLPGVDLASMQKAKDNAKLVAWVKEQYDAAKSTRQTKALQWNTNLAFYYGKQTVQQALSTMPDGYRDALIQPKGQANKKQRTVNRIRSFVRTDHSKFLSSTPQIIVVPSTQEEQDVRAAFAGEQAWTSIRETQNLRKTFAQTAWWMILTGNGFLKTSWDNTVLDKASGELGSITFANINPFQLFVPDLREVEIEDQPFVIYASVKSVAWCQTFYGDELKGVDLKPSVASQNSIVDEGTLNLSTAGKKADSVIIYEAWVKPGATPLLPQGGVVITIDDHLVGFYESMPYKHGMYPFTHYPYVPTGTFYADSPINDIIDLQREYNDLRTDISDAARKTGRPQYVAQKNSISATKWTNETGLVIEYKPGTAPPQPFIGAPLPQYLIDQQDRILQDFEDLTGQHEVSKGDAPAGVTAGTAINYLQEKDDQFNTPQYQGVEDGEAKNATMALSLFNQYIDVPRKIKVIGADQTFDTLMLDGSDIAGASDVRTEVGSSVGQSKAASDARVMDMFNMGLVDQPTALRLLEIGGAQKVLDVMSAAAKKANRENIRMKMLTPEILQTHEMEFQQQAYESMQEQMMNPDPMAQDDTQQPSPGGLESPRPDELNTTPVDGPPGMPPTPPVIPVDDFDVHEIHIDEHNKFRMSQEYEALPDQLKQQFALHVQLHTNAMQQKQMMNFLNMVPSDGSDQSASDTGDEVTTPGQAADAGAPDGTVAGNGAVPDAAPADGTGGGTPNG